jgi:NAD(P)-dependent dehydrogenase (short-subunit alcohol dehydrogenase family)
MLTSVLESGVSVGSYPELAGKRILITGLDLHAGVDVARAFAEQGCRIVLHTTASGAEADAVLEMLSQTASELQVYSDPLKDMDSAIRFAQTAAKTFNGLDAVVNLVQFEPSAVAEASDADDLESAIARQMQNATLVTRVAANRMRLTWSEGLILNIMTCSPPRSDFEAALLSIARTMLASMTRNEAKQWADQAIRINAVAPSLELQDGGEHLATEPDIAALAMFLASPRGRELSGLIFDTAMGGVVEPV